MTKKSAPSGQYRQQSHQSDTERGATLVFALAFTLLFAGMLIVLSQSRTTQNQIARSGSTGWQVAEIAKAARLYIRNNAFGGGSLGDDGVADTVFDATTLWDATNAISQPVEIYLEDLVSAGYLPDSFIQAGNRTQNVGAGSVALTVYDQQIRVFAANVPLDLDPNDPDNHVVPSVYVVLEGSPQVSPSVTRSISSSISNYGINFAAPLFDNTGTNISDDCNGAPAVAIWDAGCINQTDYDASFGAVIGNFTQGDLVIPAWRVERIDTQIVSRFPQPGNANYATMLTDLHLGSCEGTQLQLIQDSAGATDGSLERVDSEICDSLPDTTDTDNRVDLLGVASMDVQRLIAADQHIDRSVGDEYVAYVTSAGVVDGNYNDSSLEPDAEARAQTGATAFLDDGIILNSQFDESLLLGGIVLSGTTGAHIPGDVRIFSLQKADSLPTPDDDFTQVDTGITLPLGTQEALVGENVTVSDDRGGVGTSDMSVDVVSANRIFALNMTDPNDLSLLTLTNDLSLQELRIGALANINGTYSLQSIEANTVTARNLDIAFGGLTTNTLTLDGVEELDDASTQPLTFEGGNVAIIPEITLNSGAIGGSLSRIATPDNSSTAAGTPGQWPTTIIRDGVDINAPLVMDVCRRDCPEF